MEAFCSWEMNHVQFVMKNINGALILFILASCAIELCVSSVYRPFYKTTHMTEAGVSCAAALLL